jgi:hypothetical protein
MVRQEEFLTSFLGGVFVNKEEITDVIGSLVEPGVFAVLAVLTAEGEVVLRPIGGRWGAGIVDAVQEMAEKYPGCRMRLFEQNDDWERYYKGIVSKEQVISLSLEGLSPETRAALEGLQRKVHRLR